LVHEKPEFAEYLREAINEMLKSVAAEQSSTEPPADTSEIPIPGEGTSSAN
jgi:hypothetical protein